MATLNGMAILVLATAFSFFLALAVQWASLSLLFLFLPGTGRAVRLPQRAPGPVFGRGQNVVAEVCMIPPVTAASHSALVRRAARERVTAGKSPCGWLC